MQKPIDVSYGQVWTTVLKDQRLEDIIPNHSTKPVTNVKIMPTIDIAAVLRQDSINGNILSRYGVNHQLPLIKMMER